MAITRTIPEVTTTKGEAPERIYLLTTDASPFDASNGSKIIEIDTGAEFLFDAENQKWYDKNGDEREEPEDPGDDPEDNSGEGE